MENTNNKEVIENVEKAAGQMERAVTKKVTLEELIRKKLERDNRKMATKGIYIKSLDGEIIFKNPSDMQRIEFADKTKTGSYVDMLEAYGKLIYDCCPTLHSKELQDRIDVIYPYDTISAIFDTDEIAEIGVKVLNFFDDEKENDVEGKVKN